MTSIAPASSSPVRLVLADDDPNMVAALTDLLESQGHQVVATAPDGAAALAMIEQHRPDLAILDHRMPKLTGIEVARALAATNLGIPVIVLSAFDDPHLQLEADRVGVVDYLVKGCPSNDLFRTINSHTSGPDTPLIRDLRLCRQG